MVNFKKRISFLSLLILLIISLSNCQNNTVSDNSIRFFNDFENDTVDVVWKNMRRIESDSAFSGNYVCECPANLTYAFGFNYKIEDSIKNANALVSIDMMIKAKTKLNAVFVFSLERDGKTVLWNSFPMSNGFVAENQWYNNSFSLNLPNDVIKDSKLNCYVLNGHNEYFVIDDFKFNLKYFNLSTYLNEVEEYDIPKDLKNIFNTKSVNILYSEKKGQIVLADENDSVLTKPLSLYYSLIVDNDTVEVQISEFQNSATQQLSNSATQHFTTNLTLSSEENNPNVNFYLETTFNEDVKILKSSLIIPFLNDDFTVYRRNPFVDTCDYQDVYYLDKEGFSVSCSDKQLNLYHPDDVSSIQLDVKNATAHINADYYYDHLLVRFELLDTVDYYIDNSSTIMKKGESLSSSFVI